MDKMQIAANKKEEDIEYGGIEHSVFSLLEESLQPTRTIKRLVNLFEGQIAKLMEEIDELKKNNLLQQELITNISHDLRSPLVSIQGYLEMILAKEETLEAKERRRMLGIILRNAGNLSKMVNELFELSRLETGQFIFNPEPFSIAELAQDALLKFYPQANEKKIELKSFFTGVLPFVWGDIGMIERVLSNLIDNAIQHTTRGGVISIETADTGKKVSLKISDTGCGIAPEDLPHIFNRFYRVKKNGSSHTSGGGLGLAITQNILRKHNSDISVQSFINRGTTFNFELEIYRN